MEGAQVKGMGVDCMRFAGAVWDTCRGLKAYSPIVNHRPGVTSHDPAKGMETLFQLLQTFSPLLTVREGILEPGDLIVTAEGRRGGVGHVFLVGTRRGTLWASQAPSGVQCRPIIQISGHRIIRIYRPTDKARWA